MARESEAKTLRVLLQDGGNDASAPCRSSKIFKRKVKGKGACCAETATEPEPEKPGL